MKGGRACWIRGGKTINGGISNVDGGRNTMNGRKLPWTKMERSICELNVNLEMEGGDNINGRRKSMKEGKIYMNRGRSIVGGG